MKAALVLEDGTVVEGCGFGAEGLAQGELVFNTSMTGYVEALTDPSYAGQILMMTYPLIGNYGVCNEDYESDRIQTKGFVIKHLCRHPSNWRSQKNLDHFLKEFNIPGIEGVDTRMLTLKARVHGTMKATLAVFKSKDMPSKEELIENTKKQPHISEINLVDKVCVKKPKFVGTQGKHHVVIIDCGVKNSIIRQLTVRGVDLHVVPYDFPADKVMDYDPDAVFISNGPGDPARVTQTIQTIRSLVGEVPVAGICLGLQLTSLAMGAKTFKLKFGHRGTNQPVKDFDTGRVFISTQNHGFAVDDNSLKETGLEITQRNLNDGTVEGIQHKDLPLFAVQYHPEAGPGPHDTYFFFDRFMQMLE
ncbi:glutamine-hydrolyzing carbamoyl-phosphate synthase small subunit [Candidatus Bathyarchaeota archaeon]|nr:glutamine-hydrolyzing carbamoyl-phosphate synthase small subunit [Candidatus Bathyarchaeota archaeon]